MAVTVICDDCRRDMTGDETICRACVEAKNAEISDLQDKLKEAESNRDDYAFQLEDMRRERSD